VAGRHQNGSVISTDATSALIQPEKSPEAQRQACKKAHFFTAVVDTDYVLFAYAERHTQELVKRLFGGFKGFLQCDAHNIYDILERGPPKGVEEGIVLVGCWAHCRRRFFEAAICKYPVGVQGLMRIRAIYAADEAFRGLPPAKRKLMRAEHLRPLLVSFFDWVKQARVVAEGRNLATDALGYAFNQEKELLRVLDDGRLALDNTRSERSLRKIVVGRKNWMFYGSDAHAQSAAAAFSIIASCRLHSLDPEQYLDEVLRVLPYWPKERYLELAPNHWAATRAKLRSDELNAPLCSFTVPAREAQGPCTGWLGPTDGFGGALTTRGESRVGSYRAFARSLTASPGCAPTLLGAGQGGSVHLGGGAYIVTNDGDQSRTWQTARPRGWCLSSTWRHRDTRITPLPKGAALFTWWTETTHCATRSASSWR
jgi:hypothetical protein